MITQPLPFEDAIAFLLGKEQLPAEWDSEMWRRQEPDFQTKAFWSSRIENARFLDRAQGFLFDYLAKVRDEVTLPDGTKSTVLRVGGREDFVKLMRDFMIEEGMASWDEFQDVDQNDVRDIRSLARLRLIFDTSIRQSYGFGQWKQGMTPAVLRAFPAARLIRERAVKQPRPRHEENLGEVRLKTDTEWWAGFINGKDIGGFEVPWGPYGFNSGANNEDVSRSEARELGMTPPRGDITPPENPKITDGTKVSTKRMNPDLKKKLLEELRERKRNRITPEQAATLAARRVRRIKLNEGMVDAEKRGDQKRVEGYREALAKLDDLEQVKDSGEEIHLGKQRPG